jgi:hypothetical protein
MLNDQTPSQMYAFELSLIVERAEAKDYLDIDAPECRW